MEQRELDFGVTKSFSNGETIYEEGAAACGAYLVLDGSVDLFRTKDQVLHFLGSIKEGCLFGEASAITGETRSVTARANGACRLLRIARDDFLQAVKDPLVKHIVTAMAGRLRERYIPKRERLIQPAKFTAIRSQPKKARKHTFEPVIEGITPLVIGVMRNTVRVQHLPFVVGNSRVSADMGHLTDQSLMLPLPTASDFDVRHFEFFRSGPNVCVRDLGSKYGTVVNGIPISKYDKRSEIALDVGENTVGTGGYRSKVTFLITLPGLDE